MTTFDTRSIYDHRILGSIRGARIVKELTARVVSLPVAHQHMRMVRRPWWDWIRWWGHLRRWSDPDLKRQEVWCRGMLDGGTPAKLRTEFVPDNIAWKVVVSKSWRCQSPPAGFDPTYGRYAAAIITEKDLVFGS